MDLKEEQYFTNNISFDDNDDNQLSNGFFFIFKRKYWKSK